MFLSSKFSKTSSSPSSMMPSSSSSSVERIVKGSASILLLSSFWGCLYSSKISYSVAIFSGNISSSSLLFSSFCFSCSSSSLRLNSSAISNISSRCYFPVLSDSLFGTRGESSISLVGESTIWLSPPAYSAVKVFSTESCESRSVRSIHKFLGGLKSFRKTKNNPDYLLEIISRIWASLYLSTKNSSTSACISSLVGDSNTSPSI